MMESADDPGFLPSARAPNLRSLSNAAMLFLGETVRIVANRSVRLAARATLREWWGVRFKREGRGEAGEHPLAVLGTPAQPIAALGLLMFVDTDP